MKHVATLTAVLFAFAAIGASSQPWPGHGPGSNSNWTPNWPPNNGPKIKIFDDENFTVNHFSWSGVPVTGELAKLGRLVGILDFSCDGSHSDHLIFSINLRNPAEPVDLAQNYSVTPDEHTCGYHFNVKTGDGTILLSNSVADGVVAHLRLIPARLIQGRRPNLTMGPQRPGLLQINPGQPHVLIVEKACEGQKVYYTEGQGQPVIEVDSSERYACSGPDFQVNLGQGGLFLKESTRGYLVRDIAL